MTLYHVLVSKEDNWFIGRVLERDGITTEGKSLDELVFMIRDAISLMWNEKSVQLELVVPSEASQSSRRTSRKRPRLVQ
jgi:predicted RNase H-like HicB family nuclease